MAGRWFRLEADMVDHPKVRLLEEELSDPKAGWYVVRALSWLSRFCPTGQIRDTMGQALEDACQWRGTRGTLVSALLKTGWLDPSPGVGHVWHDWDDHQGKVASRAEKDRERKRAWRSRKAENVPRDVRGTGLGQPDGTNADVRTDETRRDETRRDETRRDLTPLSKPDRPAKPPRQVDLIERPPDPRHAPLVAGLTEAFWLARGAKYPFDGGRDAKRVTKLLAMAEPEALLAAWKRALAHTEFPTIGTLADFERHLPRFLGESRNLDGRSEGFDHAASWGQK